ncbi:MAG: bacillithiol system redox-active protein YtxJ [Bacteroidota bacterium]
MQDWKKLETGAQLQALIKASHERPQLIFKHSIRCGISAQAWDHTQGETRALTAMAELHYLDLINFRSVSNAVADTLSVPHQSPQAILVRDGKAVYSASHFSIDVKAIIEAAQKVLQ